MADRESGLQIIQISEPTSPSFIGSCDTPGYADGVAISESGDFAYVADGPGGLQVIDISNPTSPSIVGSCNTPAGVVAISESGNYVFVVDIYSGLRVIDISEPTSPSIVGSCDTPGFAREVAISEDGQFAFVADGYNRLLQFKINEHPCPKGNLILVAGGDIDYQTPYWHGTQTLTNEVFRTFITQGYGVYDIYYFNPGSIQDINQDGYPWSGCYLRPGSKLKKERYKWA